MIRAAAWQGLAVEGLAFYRHPDAGLKREALVIGYGTPTDSAWAGTLEALLRVLT